MLEKKNHQPPLTVEQQIENLKELDLIIKDEEFAKSFLNDVSYFRIVKAYSLGLKVRNGKYFNGVTFEHIVSLYLFNANFRQQLFAQIERIEINLRCRMANYFSNKYGVFGYENSNNFSSPEYHADFIDEINKEILRNQSSPFIKNFLNTYHEEKIPFYALIELFSFGLLSKFYKNMLNEDKKAISGTFNVGYTYFESWIESLSYVRNICAHYGRLYNATFVKKPILYKQYSAVNISNAHVFSTLLCLKHLLPNDRHWTEFVEIIEMLFEKYPDVKPEFMGFPTNWKDYL